MINNSKTMAEPTTIDGDVPTAEDGDEGDTEATMFTRWELKIPIEPKNPFEAYTSVFITVKGMMPLGHHLDAVKDHYDVDTIMEMEKVRVMWVTPHARIIFFLLTETFLVCACC